MIPFRAKAPNRAFVALDASKLLSACVSLGLGGVISGYTIKRQQKTGTFEFMCVTLSKGRRRETVSWERYEQFLNAMKKNTRDTPNTPSPLHLIAKYTHRFRPHFRHGKSCEWGILGSAGSSSDSVQKYQDVLCDGGVDCAFNHLLFHCEPLEPVCTSSGISRNGCTIV